MFMVPSTEEGRSPGSCLRVHSKLQRSSARLSRLYYCTDQHPLQGPMQDPGSRGTLTLALLRHGKRSSLPGPAATPQPSNTALTAHSCVDTSPFALP